jgi:hypothetical protein
MCVSMLKACRHTWARALQANAAGLTCSHAVQAAHRCACAAGAGTPSASRKAGAASVLHQVLLQRPCPHVAPVAPQLLAAGEGQGVRLQLQQVLLVQLLLGASAHQGRDPGEKQPLKSIAANAMGRPGLACSVSTAPSPVRKL